MKWEGNISEMLF